MTKAEQGGEHDRPLTWAALLAHWTAFAQSSLALPKTAEGERWKSAVPSIIALQAVTHALADLDGFKEKAGAGPTNEEVQNERALGQDKASILIREHSGALNGLWRSEALPTELIEIMQDAALALQVSRECGMEWRVKQVDAKGQPLARLELEHAAELGEALVAGGFDGDLYVASAGVSVMPGSPVGFARGRFGGDPGADVRGVVREFLGDVEKPVSVPRFRQVYRQYDFGTGKVRRDLVVASNESLVAGQPLLVPVVARGKMCPVTLPPPPGALERLSGIRVEVESPEAGGTSDSGQ